MAGLPLAGMRSPQCAQREVRILARCKPTPLIGANGSVRVGIHPRKPAVEVGSPVKGPFAVSFVDATDDLGPAFVLDGRRIGMGVPVLAGIQALAERDGAARRAASPRRCQRCLPPAPRLPPAGARRAPGSRFRRSRSGGHARAVARRRCRGPSSTASSMRFGATARGLPSNLPAIPSWSRADS